MTVKHKFVLKDGTVVDTLPVAEMEKFFRRFGDIFNSLAYEAVMRDLQQERDGKTRLQKL